jgi:hypothetical protein
VLATPPAGVTVTPLAPVAQFGEIDAKVKTGDWKSEIRTKGLSDLHVLQVTIAPGGTFGWHSHPGPSLVIVKSGTASLYKGGHAHDGEDEEPLQFPLHGTPTPSALTRAPLGLLFPVGGGRSVSARPSASSVVANIAAAPTPASVQSKPPSRTLTTTVAGRSRLGSGGGFASAWLGAAAIDSSSASTTNHRSPLVMLIPPPFAIATSPSMWWCAWAVLEFRLCST